MNRFAIEALGREELEVVVSLHDVDRADLGHHVGGDQHNDPIEFVLGGDRRSHDRLAKPPQQNARSSEAWSHQIISLERS